MKGKGIRRWLFPDKSNIGIRWRFIAALILNLALVTYFLPRREHLWDIRDFRYVEFNFTFTFIIVGISSVLVLALVPVIVSGHITQRWLAIVLALFPAYLVLVGWTQLILFWVSDR